MGFFPWKKKSKKGAAVIRASARHRNHFATVAGNTYAEGNSVLNDRLIDMAWRVSNVLFQKLLASQNETETEASLKFNDKNFTLPLERVLYPTIVSGIFSQPMYSVKRIIVRPAFPKLADTYNFLYHLGSSMHLSPECFVIALVYLERVLATPHLSDLDKIRLTQKRAENQATHNPNNTGFGLQLDESSWWPNDGNKNVSRVGNWFGPTQAEQTVYLLRRNWRSIFLGCLLLASKVWEDVSAWNAEFTLAVPSYPLRGINKLERVLCAHLDFKLHVEGSQYARYYCCLQVLGPCPLLSQHQAFFMQQQHDDKGRISQPQQLPHKSSCAPLHPNDSDNVFGSVIVVKGARIEVDKLTSSDQVLLSLPPLHETLTSNVIMKETNKKDSTLKIHQLATDGLNHYHNYHHYPHNDMNNTKSSNTNNNLATQEMNTNFLVEDKTNHGILSSNTSFSPTNTKNHINLNNTNNIHCDDREFDTHNDKHLSSSNEERIEPSMGPFLDDGCIKNDFNHESQCQTNQESRQVREHSQKIDEGNIKYFPDLSLTPPTPVLEDEIKQVTIRAPTSCTHEERQSSPSVLNSNIISSRFFISSNSNTKENDDIDFSVDVNRNKNEEDLTNTKKIRGIHHQPSSASHSNRDMSLRGLPGLFTSGFCSATESYFEDMDVQNNQLSTTRIADNSPQSKNIKDINGSAPVYNRDSNIRVSGVINGHSETKRVSPAIKANNTKYKSSKDPIEKNDVNPTPLIAKSSGESLIDFSVASYIDIRGFHIPLLTSIKATEDLINPQIGFAKASNEIMYNNDWDLIPKEDKTDQTLSPQRRIIDANQSSTTDFNDITYYNNNVTTMNTNINLTLKNKHFQSLVLPSARKNTLNLPVPLNSIAEDDNEDASLASPTAANMNTNFLSIFGPNIKHSINNNNIQSIPSSFNNMQSANTSSKTQPHLTVVQAESNKIGISETVLADIKYDNDNIDNKGVENNPDKMIIDFQSSNMLPPNPTIMHQQQLTSNPLGVRMQPSFSLPLPHRLGGGGRNSYPSVNSTGSGTSARERLHRLPGCEPTTGGATCPVSTGLTGLAKVSMNIVRTCYLPFSLESGIHFHSNPPPQLLAGDAFFDDNLLVKESDWVASSNTHGIRGTNFRSKLIFSLHVEQARALNCELSFLPSSIMKTKAKMSPFNRFNTSPLISPGMIQMNEPAYQNNNSSFHYNLGGRLLPQSQTSSFFNSQSAMPIMKNEGAFHKNGLSNNVNINHQITEIHTRPRHISKKNIITNSTENEHLIQSNAKSEAQKHLPSPPPPAKSPLSVSVISTQIGDAAPVLPNIKINLPAAIVKHASAYISNAIGIIPDGNEEFFSNSYSHSSSIDTNVQDNVKHEVMHDITSIEKSPRLDTADEQHWRQHDEQTEKHNNDNNGGNSNILRSSPNIEQQPNTSHDEGAIVVVMQRSHKHDGLLSINEEQIIPEDKYFSVRENDEKFGKVYSNRFNHLLQAVGEGVTGGGGELELRVQRREDFTLHEEMNQYLPYSSGENHQHAFELHAVQDVYSSDDHCVEMTGGEQRAEILTDSPCMCCTCPDKIPFVGFRETDVRKALKSVFDDDAAVETIIQTFAKDSFAPEKVKKLGSTSKEQQTRPTKATAPSHRKSSNVFSSKRIIGFGYFGSSSLSSSSSSSTSINATNDEKTESEVVLDIDHTEASLSCESLPAPQNRDVHACKHFDEANNFGFDNSNGRHSKNHDPVKQILQTSNLKKKSPSPNFKQNIPKSSFSEDSARHCNDSHKKCHSKLSLNNFHSQKLGLGLEMKGASTTTTTQNQPEGLVICRKHIKMYLSRIESLSKSTHIPSFPSFFCETHRKLHLNMSPSNTPPSLVGCACCRMPPTFVHRKLHELSQKVRIPLDLLVCMHDPFPSAKSKSYNLRTQQSPQKSLVQQQPTSQQFGDVKVTRHAQVLNNNSNNNNTKDNNVNNNTSNRNANMATSNIKYAPEQQPARIIISNNKMNNIAIKKNNNNNAIGNIKNDNANIIKMVANSISHRSSLASSFDESSPTPVKDRQQHLKNENNKDATCHLSHIPSIQFNNNNNNNNAPPTAAPALIFRSKNISAAVTTNENVDHFNNKPATSAAAPALLLHNNTLAPSLRSSPDLPLLTSSMSMQGGKVTMPPVSVPHQQHLQMKSGNNTALIAVNQQQQQQQQQQFLKRGVNPIRAIRSLSAQHEAKQHFPSAQKSNFTYNPPGFLPPLRNSSLHSPNHYLQDANFGSQSHFADLAEGPTAIGAAIRNSSGHYNTNNSSAFLINGSNQNLGAAQKRMSPSVNHFSQSTSNIPTGLSRQLTAAVEAVAQQHSSKSIHTPLPYSPSHHHINNYNVANRDLKHEKCVTNFNNGESVNVVYPTPPLRPLSNFSHHGCSPPPSQYSQQQLQFTVNNNSGRHGEFSINYGVSSYSNNYQQSQRQTHNVHNNIVEPNYIVPPGTGVIHVPLGTFTSTANNHHPFMEITTSFSG